MFSSEKADTDGRINKSIVMFKETLELFESSAASRNANPSDLFAGLYIYIYLCFFVALLYVILRSMPQLEKSSRWVELKRGEDGYLR